MEYLLWALSKGTTDPWAENLLLTGASMEVVNKVKKEAVREGYHHFRVSVFDITQRPDFVGTLRRI